MQAPTGSGKTWAALLPYIYAKAHDLSFPGKLIYSLPLRTLANSLYLDVKNNSYIKELGLLITLQTGEQPNDPYFLDGDIIFTTIDQSLSALLSIPLSLSKRQANINAGALIGSYLIFDEFHLLEYQRSFCTLLHLLSFLRGFSPFCLMTATMSGNALTKIGQYLDASIISVSIKEISLIPSQQNKQRKLYVYDKELELHDIVSRHTPGYRDIVLFNTVAPCQEFFKELITLKKKGENTLRNTTIICIHSRFFGKDRINKESEIRHLFRKGSDSDAILVSTQVIEVGIDISCDKLYTEGSPISSFLQRAGRCARFENESGEVYVYRPKYFHPYPKNISELSLKELSTHTGENLNYALSLNLIDNILSTGESDALNGIFQSKRMEDIKRAWISCSKSEAHNLIRDLNTISVVLLPTLDNVRNPYEYETISISKYTLINQLKKIASGDWVAKSIRTPNFIEDVDDENSFNFEYSFETISHEDIMCEQIVLLNPRFFHYNKEIGLSLLDLQEITYSNPLPSDSLCDNDFTLSYDTFTDHNEALLNSYIKYFSKNSKYTISCFQIAFKNVFSIEELENIISFMIIMHDYGKLNLLWQKRAHHLQQSNRPVPDNILLAHTDNNRVELVNSKFPPHSGQGAVASIYLLEQILKNKGIPDRLVHILCTTVASSILRHHSATSVNCDSFQTTGYAFNILKDLLVKHCKQFNFINIVSNSILNFSSENLSDFVVPAQAPYDEKTTVLLYFFLVRVLRLSDQKAFNIKQIQEAESVSG